MNKPRNPYHVLLASILPGGGHVLIGQAQRGLMFIFFIVVLGWISTKFMPPHATFIGRHIGGVFIYGLSILDAYKQARINWEKWRYAQTHRTGDPGPDQPGSGGG